MTVLLFLLCDVMLLETIHFREAIFSHMHVHISVDGNNIQLFQVWLAWCLHALL